MHSLVRLSEAATLAFHAAGLLAGSPGGRLGTAEMAWRLQVSAAHLSKVMTRLVKAELVRAVRGPGGGFELMRPPAKTPVLAFMEAVEGPLGGAGCPISVAGCGTPACLLSDRFRKASDELVRFLAETPLSAFRWDGGGGAVECGTPVSKETMR